MHNIPTNTTLKELHATSLSKNGVSTTLSVLMMGKNLLLLSSKVSPKQLAMALSRIKEALRPFLFLVAPRNHYSLAGMKSLALSMFKAYTEAN
jgi:hypothetical protein